MADYPVLEAHGEIFDQTLPAKERSGEGDAPGELVATKFVSHGGDQGTIYAVDGAPVLFKNIDDQLFPTGLFILCRRLFSDVSQYNFSVHAMENTKYASDNHDAWPCVAQVI